VVRLRLMRFVSYLLVTSWSLPVFGQDVADKPDLRLGDEWVFLETGNEGGKPVNRKWRRKIVEMLPDDTFRVFPKFLDADVFDRSWNVRRPELSNTGSIDFQFPLKVGASWSFASPTGSITTNGNLYDLHGNNKVVAIESITVPAGTFRCLRIEGVTDFIMAHGHGNADDKYVELLLSGFVVLGAIADYPDSSACMVFSAFF
jgi:hypothetical protein